MNRHLKFAVFAVFMVMAIMASAFVMAVMGQDTVPKHKKFTKTITLKMTRDENGNIISCDTTFSFESPDFNGHDPMIFHFDEEGLEKSMKELENGIQHFNFRWCDSAQGMTFPAFPPRMFFLDSLEEGMMKFDLKFEDDIEALKEHSKELEKTFEIQLRCQDSLLRSQQNFEFRMDSICPRFFFYNTPEGDAGDEKDVRVYKYVEPDKQHKVIIIDKDGSEIADESKVKVWKTEDGKAIIIKTKTSFAEIAETTKTELQDAGIKPPKKDLEIEDLMISPNPGDGKFTLSFRLKEPKPITIRIYDQNGKVVYEEKIKDFYGYYSKEIDLSDKPQGTFFIQILQGLYSVIKKLMII